MCHVSHIASMRSINIRTLHQATGQWVRRAARQQIIVTDRGVPVAALVAYRPTLLNKPLPDREAWITGCPVIPVDSGAYISEMRDDAS